jgi:hypothetical protein
LSSPFEYYSEVTSKKPIFVSSRSIEDPEVGTGECGGLYGAQSFPAQLWLNACTVPSAVLQTLFHNNSQ